MNTENFPTKSPTGRRYGVRTIATLEQLLAKAQVAPSGCIEWRNKWRNTSGGYGIVQTRNKEWAAHRLAYTLAVGPIPEGMCIMHTCDNPVCINPEHLRLGTWADNNRDRAAKGRSADTHGEKHPRTSLTNDDVRQIKLRLAEGGRTLKELGSEFGVTDQVIHKIKSGKNWAGVTI